MRFLLPSSSLLSSSSTSTTTSIFLRRCYSTSRTNAATALSSPSMPSSSTQAQVLKMISTTRCMISSSAAASNWWCSGKYNSSSNSTLSTTSYSNSNKQSQQLWMRRNYRRTMGTKTMTDGPTALNMDTLRLKLEELAPTIATSLQEDGYYSSNDPTGSILFDDCSETSQHILETIRQQAISLRDDAHRYEQSWSESIASDGKRTRFDKPGVFACEPDGQDYDLAPDLVSYMSILITTLPMALNEYLSDDVAQISDSAFNAKLAVTCPNSEYPLHVDNSVGVHGGDTRKLTCILYLNPNYKDDEGGELRIHLLDDKTVDVTPNGWLLFWTDEIPHKVLKTSSNAEDRYALTIWLADMDPISHIHSPKSKFSNLRLDAF